MKTLGVTKTNRRNQSGFTIIELVVVILLLGILTATALPRFLDVTDEAHAAVVSATRAGFLTGTGLYRAAWVAANQPGPGNGVVQFGDGTLGPNSGLNGYPAETSGGDGIVDAGADCDDIFTGVLQSGRPSTAVVAGLTAVPDAGDLLYTDDFTVIPVDADTCHYYYTAQGAAVSSPALVYELATGAVDVGTPL